MNLAARLESHTKVAGCEILFDQTTRASLRDTSRIREITDVRLKGFADTVTACTFS